MNQDIERFDKAILNGDAIWWQMYLPSGEIVFSKSKAKILGYPENKFKKYQDFTEILHPEDYDKAMSAMKDHLNGKKELYEVLYRIKNNDGKYVRFYDCGKIANKENEKMSVMGFVFQIQENQEFDEQINFFKQLLTKDNPPLIDLFSRI